MVRRFLLLLLLFRRCGLPFAHLLKVVVSPSPAERRRLPDSYSNQDNGDGENEEKMMGQVLPNGEDKESCDQQNEVTNEDDPAFP